MNNVDQIKQHLSENDPVLAKIIGEIPFPSIDSSGNVFHDLMSLIIEQQIHYRSTKKIFEKLLIQANIQELTPENFHQLEEIGFGSARLSEKKFQTMNEVLELFRKDDIQWNQLSNDEVRDHLKKINGIGTKTIDALLIYTLQRDDVFIPDDYHLQKVIPTLYGFEVDKKLTSRIKELAENWSPFGSHAFRYLLAWKDHKRK